VNKSPGTHGALVTLLVISHVLLTDVELEILVLFEGLVTEGTGKGSLGLVLVSHMIPEGEHVRQLLTTDVTDHLWKEPVMLLDMPQVGGPAGKLLSTLITQELLDWLILDHLATSADAAQVHFDPDHLLVDDQHVLPVLPVAKDDLETALNLTLDVLGLVADLVFLEPLARLESLAAHVTEEVATDPRLLFLLDFLPVWIALAHSHVSVSLWCVPEPLIAEITMFRSHSLLVAGLAIPSPFTLLLLFTVS